MEKQDPDTFDSLEQDTAGDTGDASYIAPDEPMAVHAYGTTRAEERAGETFAERTKHTNPDFDEGDLAESVDTVGRLIQPGDEDVDAIDDEASVVAWAVGDDADLSAEEAAMHTINTDES